MANVRALLREQLSVRRIGHPLATYSASGKLVCALCQVAVKTDGMWDEHLRSASHRETQRKSGGKILQAHREANAEELKRGSDIGSGNGSGFQKSKRKHDELDDATAVSDGSQGDEYEGMLSTKRSRSEISSLIVESNMQVDTSRKQSSVSSASSASPALSTSSTAMQITPPLGRRTSGTPAHGIELQIPSRPATPSARDSFTGSGGQPSAASTPKLPTTYRSSSLVEDGAMLPTTSATSFASASGATVDKEEERIDNQGAAKDTNGREPGGSTKASSLYVNEAEWAAFEADVVENTSNMPNGAVAPTAPELADDEKKPKEKSKADKQIEDDKEEATRALEAEFEDMIELESRVKKLKEKREALRRQNIHDPALPLEGGTVSGVKTKDTGHDTANDSGDNEDDDDGDDDWDGFRFKV